MRITVVVCTYNRCEDLAKALDSLLRSKLPDSVEWEILVVDNNSNDGTRSVASDFSIRHPGRVRYLLEPHPGKSHALNSGIRESHGDVLVFTDDDITVEPTWLRNLTAPLDQAEWACVGGRTLPQHAFAKPRWLPLEGPFSMGGALALFDLGNEPRELDRPPYGVNMAVRKGIFEKYGGFRIDLGPTPDGRIPRANEDTELGRRLMAAGERLKYEPSAVVYHPIPADRLKRKYFLRWHFDYGRAQIRERGERPPVWVIPRHYFSIPRILGIQLSTRVVRWMFTLNPERRFFWKSWVWMTVGEVVEIPRVVRDVKKKREKALKRENVDCKAEV